MDLIVTALLQAPAFWNYDPPLNLLAIASVLFGILLQPLLLRKNRKFALCSVIWLVVSLCCEYLYQTIRGFEAFGPALFGMFTYLVFFGSLLGILGYFVWTKKRHS